ncbi:MAG: class I SAM-dependent methyltransferase [Verrucomicrobiota bacterium]
MSGKPDDIVAYNREKWDAQVAKGDRWTVPFSPDVIARARQGEFSILLTPSKPVPMNWFPPLEGCRVLCLASGGGQQGPVLAAAGAEVTVFDNSPRQLAQDRLVAKREDLEIETVEGDMGDLSRFEPESFDFVFHPCSNGFVDDVKPVWRGAFRVLRPGGDLVSGFCNPVLYLFDDERRAKGELVVRHRIHYSDLTSLTDEEFARYSNEDDPASFGHTLDDQIGGQIAAGFAITGFYKDDWGAGSEEALSKYIKTFIATKATKPA